MTAEQLITQLRKLTPAQRSMPVHILLDTARGRRMAEVEEVYFLTSQEEVPIFGREPRSDFRNEVGK